MNDFTKDELEQILFWSVSHFEQIDIDVIEMERLFSLSKKIQTMIDNYCEHSIIEPFYAGDNRHYHCAQCGINQCFKGLIDE
jgi:hypothetical protein